MSYGDTRWQEWVLPEEEAIKHIKYAYVYVERYTPACIDLKPLPLLALIRYEHGITTFDTANVSTTFYVFVKSLSHSTRCPIFPLQIYSHGQSEIILGNAIKKLGLPREELVIMTKVHGALCNDPNINILRSGKTPEEFGVINQRGLNRKVGARSRARIHPLTCAFLAHL